MAPIVVTGILGWGNGDRRGGSCAYDAYGPGGRWGKRPSRPGTGAYDGATHTRGDHLADAITEAGGTEGDRLVVLVLPRDTPDDVVQRAAELALATALVEARATKLCLSAEPHTHSPAPTAPCTIHTSEARRTVMDQWLGQQGQVAWMGDPAMAAARAEAERLGTIVGSDVDRVEDELLAELAPASRIVQVDITKTMLVRLPAEEAERAIAVGVDITDLADMVTRWQRVANYSPHNYTGDLTVLDFDEARLADWYWPEPVDAVDGRPSYLWSAREFVGRARYELSCGRYREGHCPDLDDVNTLLGRLEERLRLMALAVDDQAVPPVTLVVLVLAAVIALSGGFIVVPGQRRGSAVSIPVSALVRLLDNILGASDAVTDQVRFQGWMQDGVRLTPDLDLQDVATLARILAGEAYDDIDGRPGPARRS